VTTTTTKPRIDWVAVEEFASQHITRVLGLAGFTERRYVLTRRFAKVLYPRSEWPISIEYRASINHHLKMLDAAPPEAHPNIERTIRIEFQKAVNQLVEWMQSPVWIMVRNTPPAPELVVELDPITFNWASRTGGARGDSIVSLVSWMLGIRPSQAAYRIMRACGREEIPRVSK